MNWDAWIGQQSHAHGAIELADLTSSSALVAALVRIQIARGEKTPLKTSPAGLYGLARMLGVDERFIWEHNDATSD